MMKSDYGIIEFYIDEYFEKITTLHNKILKCFEKYGVKSMENDVDN